MNKWCYLSIGLNIVGLGLVLAFLSAKPLLRRITQTIVALPRPIHYDVQVKIHKHVGTDQADIVMLGNSITASMPWREAFPNQSIVNRGIPGDMTGGMLHRLNSILRLQPKRVYIMGGINDLLLAERSPEQVATNLKHIGQRVKKEGVEVYYFSVLYTRRGTEAKKSVEALNKKIIQICQEQDWHYLNLNQALSKEGQLKKEYTYDGLHLNSKGLKAWKRFMQAHWDDQ